MVEGGGDYWWLMAFFDAWHVITCSFCRDMWTPTVFGRHVVVFIVITVDVLSDIKVRTFSKMKKNLTQLFSKYIVFYKNL